MHWASFWATFDTELYSTLFCMGYVAILISPMGAAANEDPNGRGYVATKLTSLSQDPVEDGHPPL